LSSFLDQHGGSRENLSEFRRSMTDSDSLWPSAT
jgi:hypothetical protein